MIIYGYIKSQGGFVTMYRDVCEEDYGFDGEEDAVFALYEELMDGSDVLDRDRIYMALRYLIWSKRMPRQYDEIAKLSCRDVDALTHHEMERGIDKEVSYIKTCVQEALDQF